MMCGKQINSMSEVETNELSLSDIRWMYGIGQGSTKGTGRDKIHTYRSGVMTPIGDILESLWYELAQKLVDREGLNDLCDQLERYYKDRSHPTLYAGAVGAKKLHWEALELSVSRIFDNPGWVYFIPFNRAYRPEALAKARIVTVFMLCCQKPGEVTMEQLRGGSPQGFVFCPHCGRNASYKRPEFSLAGRTKK